MRILPAAAAAAAVTLLLPAIASAQTFFADITVGQEVPTPTGPNLNGSGTVRIDILGPSSLLVNLSASGLSTNIVGAHIHVGPPGVAGPIVLDLISSGTGTNSLTLDNVLFTSAAPNRPALSQTIAGFQAGTAYYVNIHTTQNPAGEIRGNLAIPEPGTLALLAGGALPLLRLARRRRR